MTWLPRKTIPATVLIGVAALGLAGCGTVPPGATSSPSPDVSSAAPSSSATGPRSSKSPAVDGGTCEYVTSGDAAKPVNPPPTTGVPTSGTVAYVLKMTNGDVTITMDRSKAPCTINSFVSLADQGYFNQTRCHRLADSRIFILQCGDPTGSSSGSPGYQFANETDGTETYTRGKVAMANAGPGTNGSQFFLIWDDSSNLDQTPNFTIFGEMDSAGRDVVASMAAEGQDGSNGDGTGKPNNPSEIISATRK